MEWKGCPSGYVPALIKNEHFLPTAVKHLILGGILCLVPQRCGCGICSLWSLFVSPCRSSSWPAGAHTSSCSAGQANQNGMGMWGRNRAGNKMWSSCGSWECGSKRMERWVLRRFLQWEERAGTFKVSLSITHPTCQELCKPSVEVSCREMWNMMFSHLLWGVQERVNLIFQQKMGIRKIFSVLDFWNSSLGES